MKPLNRNIKMFATFGLLAFVGIVLFAIFGLPWAAAGMTYAIGTVAPTLTQEAVLDAGTLDIADVQRKVETYKPYQTPLLTLMSDNKPLTVQSWEAKYYAVDARGLSTTISAASTISTSKVTTLTVADNTMFTKFNTVYFTGITTTTTKISSGRFLMGIVLSVGDSSTITVKLVNPGTTLAASDFVTNPVMNIYRGGSAHNETAASTSSWGIIPATDSNFVQLFMEQVEESEFQKLMKKEADWGMADLKRLAIEDFKLQRERTFLAGIKSESTVSIDGTNKTIYTCGGFLNDTGIPVLSNQDLSDIGTSSATFVSWLKTIFTGNSGNRKRYLLGGADVIEAIEKVKVDNKWLLSKESEVVLGIDFVKMVSSFGALDIAYYEQLDLLGKPKTAIVVDKQNIYTGDLKGKGFGIRKLNLTESGVAAVDANVLEQCSTMLIKNKASHHIIECVA